MKLSFSPFLVPTRINMAFLTLWAIFILMPFIDALTGYMINRDILTIGSVGSPSQLFRLLLTALLVVQIRKPLHIYISAIMIIWIMMVELINLPIHNRLDWILIGVVYSYKLAFGLIIYFVFVEYFDSQKLNFQMLQTYIVNTCAIYVLIVIISDILGISTNSYVGMELGSKGVFADGNGLGVFLGTCSLVVLDRYVEKKRITDLLLFFLTGKVLLGLMTKAGVLFFLVGLFLLYCKLSYKLKVFIGIVMIGIIILFIEPLVGLLESAFKLILWRVERSDSIWQIILGGRELYLDEASSYDYNSFSQLLKLIIGGGYRLSFRDPSSSLYEPDGVFIIEADFFDVFFMYGILGFIIYFAIFFKGLFVSKINKRNILKWSWVLLFIHSALAGHVLSSGIALLILPCILLLMEKREFID